MSDDRAAGRNGRRLKVGLSLPAIEGLMAGQTASYADLLAFAKLAEDVGFDSLWMCDHLMFRLAGREDQPVDMWEGWSVLAALAASTSRIELGPLVSCVSYRNPALTAKMACTIDEISNGRFILGLGAGWHEPEYHAYGYPFDHRGSRFEEAFTIIRSLLREGKADFDGKYHQAREIEMKLAGPRPGRIPMMIGSRGPRVLAATLPHVDGWNGDWTSRPGVIPPMREQVDAACLAVGRDPSTLERSVGVIIDLPGKDLRIDGRASVKGATEPSTKPDPPATGSIEDLAELLRGYEREGIDHVMVWLDPSTLEGVEEFGRVLELL
jgi:alkanesulfonate monooxygenase SsuD/methylene tetrahydromethanopterin reductase-like flavin-dependent oxidoreductase (luciferase family)